MLTRWIRAVRKLNEGQCVALAIAFIGFLEFAKFAIVTIISYDLFSDLPKELGGPAANPADMWVRLLGAAYGYSGAWAVAFVALQIAVPIWLIVAAMFALKGLRWPLITSLALLACWWMIAILRLPASDPRPLSSLVGRPVVYALLAIALFLAGRKVGDRLPVPGK